MVCLGFEPRAAGWEAQTKPWSYGSHPFFICYIHFKQQQHSIGKSFTNRWFMIQLFLCKTIKSVRSCARLSNVSIITKTFLWMGIFLFDKSYLGRAITFNLIWAHKKRVSLWLLASIFSRYTLLTTSWWIDNDKRRKMDKSFYAAGCCRSISFLVGLFVLSYPLMF